MPYFQNLERGSNSLIKTANKMGYMATDIDIYTQKFIDDCLQNGTYLEIGCSYGLAILPLLERGCKIIANDMEISHLSYLEDLISKYFVKHKDNLTLLHGRFPNEVSFAPESLDGILTARTLHFLTGDEIEYGLHKLFSWLKPGGKLYIISETPYRKNLAEFIPVYEERKKNNIAWPGMLSYVHSYFTESQDLPTFINFLDKDHLSEILEKIGYKLEEATNFRRQIGLCRYYEDYPNFMAVIASKPH